LIDGDVTRAGTALHTHLRVSASVVFTGAACTDRRFGLQSLAPAEEV
jgi:hypothetical protein